MEDSDYGKSQFSFYPPLYFTPTVEPTRPSSPSPSSPSSSPYVVNFKRRGPPQSGPMRNHADEVDRFDMKQSAADSGAVISSANMGTLKNGAGEGDPSHHFSPSGYGASKETCCNALQAEIDKEADLEPGTSDLSKAIIAQGTKTKPQLSLSKCAIRLNSDCFMSPRASIFEEFYDAPEVPVNDSTGEEDASSANLTFKRLGRSAEELLPCLQEEIARRIRAEEALALLQQCWHEAAQKCALMGISMTTSEDSSDRSRANLNGVYEHFSSRLTVARVVAGAVASAAIRASKDDELEGMIASKNWEISRLWDKLQYVELINREMSQRNQEVIEIVQRRKRRRKRRQKWVIGCFGSALCLGTAGLLCFKLIPWDRAGTWSKLLKSSAQD